MSTVRAFVPLRLAGRHEHMAGLNVDYYLLSYFIWTSGKWANSSFLLSAHDNQHRMNVWSPYDRIFFEVQSTVLVPSLRITLQLIYSFFLTSKKKKKRLVASQISPLHEVPFFLFDKVNEDVLVKAQTYFSCLSYDCLLLHHADLKVKPAHCDYS